MQIRSILNGLLPLWALATATTAMPALAPASEGNALEERATGFSQRAIFTPPSNYRTPKVLYPRSTFLADGKTLLATWENYSPEPPMVYFPIYKSTDGGQSWKSLSTVTDQVNGWGMRYQPFLYTLPKAFGGYPAGTVLCAGNSIPSDLSKTKLDIYASTDSGTTWKFVSSVASGGAANTEDGQTPVWEPFMMLYGNSMVFYYSDQRDSAHGQKLVHQTSTDLKNWGPVVNDVAYPTYTDRPGMTTVAALPNGKYIMTYEYGGGPGVSGGYNFPVYYRIGSDPTNFNAVPGTQLVSQDGTKPISSPFVTYTSAGGINGTIVVSSGTNAPVFINKGLGHPAMWQTMNVPIASGYSREVKFLDTAGTLMVIGAGPLGGNNYVSNAVTTIPL